MKTVARLLYFLRPLSGWVLLSVLLSAGTIASNIGLLGTSAYLIARAALHPSIAELQVAIVGVRFFGITRSVLRYAERLASHSANFRLLAGLRTWFFQRLEPLVPARMVERQSGDLLDRVVADIDNLEDFYVRTVAPPLTALLITLGMGVFVGASYARLGTVLVGGLLLSAFGVPLLARKLGREPGVKLVSARAELAAGLVDGIQGLSDLMVFNKEVRFFERLRIAGDTAGKAQLRQAAWGGLTNALNGLIVHLTLWGVLFLAIPLVTSGEMDGITLAVITLITLASFEAALPVGPAAQRLEGSLESARRLLAIGDSPPAVSIPMSPADPPRTADLRIQQLSFRYEEGLQQALCDFSLDLPAGKRVGIVGPSGAGKSTLISLLLRYWDIESGRIWLSGQDLRAYAPVDVRKMMAVVEPRPYLFHTTLRSNLRLTSPTASDDELYQVLRRVQLEAWVSALPRGLDTPLGERGNQVSGGERQRLAVARALLQNAPLWLLDEPTAHLDPRSRQSVAASLLEVTRGRSVIWVTHELSELSVMDEVLVLREGRVVERGTPRELREMGGWFARWSSPRIL